MCSSALKDRSWTHGRDSRPALSELLLCELDLLSKQQLYVAVTTMAVATGKVAVAPKVGGRSGTMKGKNRADRRERERGEKL